MNRELSIILRDAIKDLPFVGKVSGLVKTIEQNRPTENDKYVTLRFPASLDPLTPLAPGQYADMSPDSAFKSVFFVEAQSSRVRGRNSRGGIEMSSTLRLIGWLNSGFQAGAEALAIAHVLKAIPEHPINLEFIKNITITLGVVLGVEDRIFGRYTLPEEKRQFLMSPFTAFAIDFTFEFTISIHCLPEYE